MDCFKSYMVMADLMQQQSQRHSHMWGSQEQAQSCHYTMQNKEMVRGHNNKEVSRFVKIPKGLLAGAVRKNQRQRISNGCLESFRQKTIRYAAKARHHFENTGQSASLSRHQGRRLRVEHMKVTVQEISS